MSPSSMDHCICSSPCLKKWEYCIPPPSFPIMFPPSLKETFELRGLHSSTTTVSRIPQRYERRAHCIFGYIFSLVEHFHCLPSIDRYLETWEFGKPTSELFMLFVESYAFMTKRLIRIEESDLNCLSQSHSVNSFCGNLWI